MVENLDKIENDDKMGRKKTSVELTPKAEQLKEQYPYLNLKSLLSAGIVLFDGADEKQKIQSLVQAYEGEQVVADAEIAEQLRGRTKRERSRKKARR